MLWKCTVNFVFLSTRLRSSTYTITGLLAGAGHPIPSAKNAWMNFNKYSDYSFAIVQTHAPASVMYVYGRLRHSEVWLPTQFSNLAEFKLTRRTSYRQYFHALKSGIVPLDRLIPITFPKLQYTYVNFQLCDASRRFHKACTILSQHYWGPYWEVHCETDEEAVATLCSENNWWCDLCKKPFFKTATDCVFF